MFLLLEGTCGPFSSKQSRQWWWVPLTPALVKWWETYLSDSDTKLVQDSQGYTEICCYQKTKPTPPPQKRTTKSKKRGWGEESSKQTPGTTQLGLAFSIPSIQATRYVTDLCLSEPPFPNLEDESLTAIYLTVLLAYIRYFKIKDLPRVLGTI